MTDLHAHVQTLLRDKLAATDVEVIDDSDRHRGHAGSRGGAKHFRVTVVSPAFEGKTLLQRHRMVNEALAELLKKQIHSLALTTRAPSER